MVGLLTGGGQEAIAVASFLLEVSFDCLVVVRQSCYVVLPSKVYLSRTVQVGELRKLLTTSGFAAWEVVTLFNRFGRLLLG